MSERESFLRRFHTARPGVTALGLGRGGDDTEPDSRNDGYDRLIAAVPAGARVLDLACGDAYLVARLGPRAVGVDLAPWRGRQRGAALVAGRAQALPFADGAFDACVCHLAFMLFDDLAQVIRELRRVVVPGGVFAAVLGGGPTADDREGDDAFHRLLSLWSPGSLGSPGGGFGDRRARTPAGWRELFGREPAFERFELDLSGRFDDVWRFLGASYQLDDAIAPAIRVRLAAEYADRERVPCRVVMWLATVTL